MFRFFIAVIITVYASLLHATVLSTEQLRGGLSAQTFDKTLASLCADTSDDDEYWYWLNRARLQQANGDYNSSIASFEKAYAILDEYENRATISVRNIGSFVGSSLLSKGSETYYGKGYERTLMHTLNAINYIMLRKVEGAAVEMRRMEQRQEFWLIESDEKIKQAAKDKATAAARNTRTDMIPANYSMSALLNSPDIRNLLNNYQDSFSYTLGYIISEMSGLADATGNEGSVFLKRAIALNPNVTNAINSSKTSIPPGKIHVNIVVLSGIAPAMKIEKIRFPIFHAAEYTSIDLPSYTPPNNDLNRLVITNGPRTFNPPRLLKSDMMAYKTLSDEFPGELAKAAVRATTKGIAAKQASDHFGDLGGLLASLFFDLGSSIADSGFRNWETLPNSGYLMNFEAKKGETISIILNDRQESFTLPKTGKEVFILVSYLTHDNIRIDYADY